MKKKLEPTAKLCCWNLHKDIKVRNFVMDGGKQSRHWLSYELAQSYPGTEEQPAPYRRRQLGRHDKLHKVKVEVAPGFKLHGWLSSLCPRSFKENVLDECLATGTLMYQEKLAEGDEKGARRVRWAMRFWMCVPSSVAS